MNRSIVQNAPVWAAAAAITALVVAFLFQVGAAGTGFTVLFLALVVIVLAWLVWVLNRQLHFNEKSVRQLRFTAERFHAMARTFPGGYCLFTPQGLLREEIGVAKCLGRERVSHLDDLVASIKEGPELIDAFRNLQSSGESFSLQVTILPSEKSILIAGRRFQVGREGPPIDVLWFAENPAAVRMIDVARQAAKASELLAFQKQGLLDALQFPVWVRSKGLDLVLCNKAYAKALDATQDEVVEKQHELMSHTARGGTGRSLASNALEHKGAETERRHVIIAGRRRLLEITEMPIDLGDDKMALLGFAVDVTQEEEKETELQRHVAAQREVMEHLGSAVAIYGADTRLEFYNGAYKRLWDAEESFLDSHPTMGEVMEHLRERRRLPEQADFQRYKQDELSLFTSLLEPREDLLYLPDGTSLRRLIAPHPFGGIMRVFEDVTDKLALESSYNTLIAVQRETLDNLAEGIAVFGPDGKLRLYNPAFARIWALPPEFLDEDPHISDLLERMKPLFNYGSNWESFKAEIVSYTLDRSSHAGRLERADQTVIEFLNEPLPDGAVLTSYLDVSDSVKAEQALRASNLALTTADRLKSEFVANVSYQLRTPLNTIMGFAEILTNQYFGTLNERQLEYARTIMNASKKLLLLINDVLDLATIEAGRMELDRQPVQIASLLNTAKQMTSEWARQQSLDIVIECPSDIGAIAVDEQRMRQVLFNLISNSIKYTPAGGRIVLKAERQKEWVVLSVNDTGVGIPETDRERVFGKFEKANPQVRQSGAGLGLSLVKNFVELHGGRVELSTRVGEGSSMSCYLPTNEKKNV
jgi:signal transduction histidine kinase